MSWLYSLALVEAYSEANCLDGAPSAPSSMTPTPQTYLSPDRMTEFSRLSRFGMTFGHLTDDLGADVLTWFLEGFPVRTSAQPGKAQGSTENEVGSGWRWPESSVKYDPVMRLWKTRQCSLFEDSEWFSETWPRWGTMRDGECWELPMSARPTFGRGSGLWQTPVADDAVNRVKGKINSRGEPKLSAQVKIWPTPTVHGNYNRKGASKTSGDGLSTAVYATPTARDWKSGKASQETMERNSRPLSEQIGGQLNPTWVEWLMGWPLGWTDLKPLAMDRSQSAPPKHGDC
jgi:hypothetical protein